MAPKLSLLLVLPILALWAQTDADISDKNPYTSQNDVERGKRLFGINCAPCHGPEGNGGRGANLVRPKLPRATDDRALFFIIRDGIQNTEMPGAWSLSDHEIWQVSAHVRTFGRLEAEKVAGDPKNGRSLFRNKGCVRCHTVGVEGGRVGPPLTEIGERRSAAYLRAAILDPLAHLPEDFTMADITSAGGQHITGIILSEDTYSVQVRDLSDNLHSFWKNDLAKFEKHNDRTPMPAYRGQFTDTELDDLIAYLASLRGNQ